jgi:hypothetical protein
MDIRTMVFNTGVDGKSEVDEVIENGIQMLIDKGFKLLYTYNQYNKERSEFVKKPTFLNTIIFVKY